ncbi:phage tail length tape measure family protein [Cronobacter muytjensii]|uniref:phage tail length tape measure family protein n=1 Tax=Cronobacter muytjensii TaxID=413501 RepID=UPI0029FB9320|nr:phage tail protein [Cronobacter muytjensii]
MAGEQNAGGIVYEISADVAPLLQGSRQVNKALDGIDRSIADNIERFKRLDTEVSQTAKSVSAATGSMGNLRNVFGQLGYQIQDVSVQLQMGQNAMMVFAQQGSQIASIFGPGGAIAGAVIAISGALAGALLPSIFKSSDATDVLEKAQKSLSDTLTTTSSGVTTLSAKLVELSKVSADAAQAEIASGLANNAKVISSSLDIVKGTINSLGDIVPTTSAAFNSLSKAGIDAGKALSSTDSFASVREQLSALGNTSEDEATKYALMLGNISQASLDVADKFQITQTQAVGLLRSIDKFQTTGTSESLKQLALASGALASEVGGGNEAFVTFNDTVQTASQEIIKAKGNTDLLKAAQKDLSGAVSEATAELEGQRSKLMQLVSAAKNEAATVGYSARQRAKYVAGLLGANDADIKSIDASYDKIEAYENEQKALKDQEQAQKKAASEAESSAKRAASAQQQVVSQLDQLADKYELAVLEQRGMGREAAVLAAQQQLGAAASQQQAQQAGELAGKLYDVAQATKAAKEEEQKRKEASQNFDAIRGQVSPVAAADNAFQKQIEQLNQYAAFYPQRIEEVEAVRASIEEKYRQQRLAAMWDEWSQQNTVTQMTAAAFESLAGNASNALTGILTGSMSVNEALASLGRTILNSVVNSIIQMGVEYAKNIIIQQTLGSAAVAASAAQAMAAGAAWATPAALAATATAGGAAVAGAAALSTTVAGAQALALSGARKNGGPVSAGSMYRVGEGGLPEIFQASTGKQYMIPGDNGRVISNKDMQSGSGVIINNIVQNYTSATVDSQGTVNSDGSITLTTIIADLNNGGPISQGITSNFNVKRTPNGQG